MKVRCVCVCACVSVWDSSWDADRVFVIYVYQPECVCVYTTVTYPPPHPTFSSHPPTIISALGCQKSLCHPGWCQERRRGGRRVGRGSTSSESWSTVKKHLPCTHTHTRIFWVQSNICLTPASTHLSIRFNWRCCAASAGVGVWGLIASVDWLLYVHLHYLCLGQHS